MQTFYIKFALQTQIIDNNLMIRMVIYSGGRFNAIRVVVAYRSYYDIINVVVRKKSDRYVPQARPNNHAMT